MALDRYADKRNFEKTPEPGPGSGPRHGSELIYVVQQHDASRMHWDFRLELDGVLMSWAVPKGPSLDPKDKRLAVHVEDHPLDYAGFEGVIPKGEYGGGSVIVWDRGTWDPHGDPHAGMAKGDFKFRLTGDKLTGEWVLVRMKPREGEKAENWLLIKERDEFARPSSEYDVTRAEPDSVISGLTVQQVAEREAAGIDVGARPADGDDAGTDPSRVAGATKVRMPKAVDPELARLVAEPPAGDTWISEVKYDGYRVLVFVDGGKARAFTRNGNDRSADFEPLLRCAERLPVGQAILDGEAVVFGEDGITRFQLLQQAIKAAPDRITYACFDLLYLDGYDLRGAELTARKDLLARVLGDQPPTGCIRYAEHVDGLAETFYDRACRIGLEGAVLKRRDSRYAGTRSGAWLKVKCRLEQELVVGGFTDPKGARTGFGALLLGYYDADGAFVYAGRVGTGFSEVTLGDLYGKLRRIERKTPAYIDPPKGAGLHWVTPELVAQVAFQEWTAEGSIRQPSFLGLRTDKKAAEVVREAPANDAPADPAGADPPGTDRAAGKAKASVGNVVAGVTVSSPDKRLFPDSDVTKIDLARYYDAAAPLMVPQVSGRALTLLRCPSGDGAECFWQRHPDKGRSGQLHTAAFTWPGDEDPQDWLYVTDAGGLVTTAQMGVAEIHCWLSRIDTIDRPDRIIFDLDPGPGVEMPQIVRAAQMVRERMASLGFTPYLKTTGGKGVHVVVPVEPVFAFEKVRAMTKSIVDGLVADDPDMFVGRMAKAERSGKVFLDYLRNALGASAVAPYSPRARSGAPVSVPIAWEELTGDLQPKAFTLTAVLERIGDSPDPWADIDDSAAGAKVMRAAAGDLLG